jgi:peptidyl-prolyl cis-trans isomerase B (cyclophilin B)
VKASTHAEARVRYAAVYALSREHEPPADQAVIAALASRIEDRDPEIRATAIAALVKRKAITAARKPIEDSLRDRDWRVAVEAVRALAGPSGDEAGRVAVASALPARAAALANGDPVEGQVVVEGLRTLLPNPVPLPPLAGDKSIAGGWIDCLTIAAGQPVANAELADRIARCQLPDHLRLPLLAELFDDKRSDAAYRRAALRMLLSHDDPRVRAAGIGAVIKTWGDGDDRAQATIIGTIASAIGAKNPIVAGTAIESAEALYEKMGASHPLQNTLDSAIVHRAATETDVELASALFGLIGKRAIAAGAESCRAGLTGHPVRAKAAAECLRALGEAVELPQPPAPPAPPVDVADVIVGYHPRWRLETTRGTILIELQPESAPWAVAAVMALTKQGFYDGLELHRVVPNFVVQGGDPTQSGWGGPGFTLPAEPASSADGPGFVAGGVGIADAGPDSGGSQWFIMHSRAPHLDGRYTWIGHVVLGQKWADALLIGDKVLKATIDQP